MGSLWATEQLQSDSDDIQKLRSTTIPTPIDTYASVTDQIPEPMASSRECTFTTLINVDN